MNGPSFGEGIGVALALAVAGAALFTVADALGIDARLPVVVLAGVYVGYLLCRSPTRVGRVVVSVSWPTAAVLSWVLVPDATGFLLTQVLMVWVIRAVYFHSGVLAAAADLGLWAAGVAAGAWAATTGSGFLAIWSLFGVQALFSTIHQPEGDTGPSAQAHDEAFERAWRAARDALERAALTPGSKRFFHDTRSSR